MTTTEAIVLLEDTIAYLANILDTVDEYVEGRTEVDGGAWATDMAARLHEAGFRSTGEGAEIV